MATYTGSLTRLGALAGVAMALAVTPLSAWQTGQASDTTKKRTTLLTPVTVTATRSVIDVFETPKPVSVLIRSAIREQAPNTVSDMFRILPGLDVTGVGASQVRPSIRGQRGQRILLLEDGVRLSNSRRQQDFGELPALIDISQVERVEIVRGPSSVLYGSDAIGGVINVITRTPNQDGIHGNAGFRYSTHDEQQRGFASLNGRFGRFSFRANGSLRKAQEYEAPAGTFGNITLAGRTPVFDTGANDDAFDAFAGFELAAGHDVFAKFERYRADTSGFGFVDPAAYAPDEPEIQILYPFQRFDKFTAGYEGRDLNVFLADKVDVVGWGQTNERALNFNIFIPFSPTAGMTTASENRTDLNTTGFRVEAAKFAAGRVMVTYGVDYFRDRSENTDSSVTTITGFGPPMVSEDGTPQVPNATLRSLGVFVQGEIEISSRASLTLGARFQDVHATTKETQGITEPTVSMTDQKVVGTANLVFRLTNNLNAIGSVGSAFRSPNLVERFFHGVTPEGAGFQSRNLDLGPETGVNVDVGLRYRDRNVFLEGFVFRNHMRDGIRIAATGDTVNGLPVHQNVNIDKLRFSGLELAGDAWLTDEFSIGANYTHLSSKDVLDETNPIGDTFSNKIAGHIRYSHSSDRFFVQYGIRHNGERKDVDLGASPIGTVLPAFTVHTARAGVTVFRRGTHYQRIAVTVDNLTDALYAEFANAAFFRPEPRRRVLLTWDMTF